MRFAKPAAGTIACFLLAMPVAAGGNGSLGVCLPLPHPFLGFAAGDLDRDGLTDLVVLESDSSTIRVFRGNGTASILSEVEAFAIPLPTLGLDMAKLIDLDGDGALDLVVGAVGAPSLAVAYGNGDGHFSEVKDVHIPVGFRIFAAGDFNRDGVMDIVMGTEPFLSPGLRGQFVVLLGGPGRSFPQPQVLPTAIDFPHLVLAGDFNGDGNEDVAVWGRGDAPPFFSIFEGAGDGSFQEATLSEPSLNPHDYHGGNIGPQTGVAADFDGDGLDEIYLLAELPTSRVLRVSRRDGGYRAEDLGAVAGPLAGYPILLPVDLDSDGRLDFLVAGADNAITHFRSSVGDATPFGPSCALVLPSRTVGFTDGLAVGKFSGPGGQTLAVALPGDGLIQFFQAPFEECGLLATCAEGTIRACYRPQSSFPVSSPEQVLVEDFDGDGRAEIIVAGGGEARWLKFSDGQLKEAHRIAAPAAAKGLAIGDLDGDGKKDLALSDFSSGTVEVFFQDPSGEIRLPPRTLAAGLLPGELLIDDLDRDGASDIAVLLTAESKVAILAGRGDGEFREARSFDSGPAPRALGAGDFNGDGLRDLVIANGGTVQVSVLKGLPGGGFSAPAKVRVVEGPRALKVVDLNHDGRDDILVASHDLGGITLLLSQGETFQPRILNLPVGSLATAVTYQDLDGDGTGEIVAAAAGTRSILIFAGRGDGEFSPEPDVFKVRSGIGKGEALALAVGDVDGDGFQDLVVGDGLEKDVVWYRSAGCGAPVLFRRGDVNDDGSLSLTDPVVTLLHLFVGAGPLSCPDAADFDDDGVVSVTDPVALLVHLFIGGPPPASPGPDRCGLDPAADALGPCNVVSGCP